MTETHAPLTLDGVPLSVLDVAPIPEGGTADDALRATIALAQDIRNRLGYHRFWVAEHYGIPGIAELIPAARPDREHRQQHLGHPSRVRRRDAARPTSLVVAEQFGTLETLYPGRVKDLRRGARSGPQPGNRRRAAPSRT